MKTKQRKTPPTQKQQRPPTFAAVFVLHFGIRPAWGLGLGVFDAVHSTPCPPTRREHGTKEEFTQ